MSELQQLREALEFYADGRNYSHGEWSDKLQKVVAHISRDGGQRASEALEALERFATPEMKR